MRRLLFCLLIGVTVFGGESAQPRAGASRRSRHMQRRARQPVQAEAVSGAASAAAPKLRSTECAFDKTAPEAANIAGLRLARAGSGGHHVRIYPCFASSGPPISTIAIKCTPRNPDACVWRRQCLADLAATRPRRVCGARAASEVGCRGISRAIAARCRHPDLHAHASCAADMSRARHFVVRPTDAAASVRDRIGPHRHPARAPR